MADAVDRGVTVTEIASLAQPIEPGRETTAAFVGRALRGPVNEPVLVTSPGQFRRRFGDVRQAFGLGAAVEQYFEHGGRRAWVVRVSNKARGALVCLPASGGALVLRAVEPGSTERIRAAVDYDGIDVASETLFNLTLQRTDPETGFVREQEIFRRVTMERASDGWVVDRLLASAIARAEAPLPSRRPDATSGPSLFTASPYIGHAQDGSDGVPLSDYDLIGSRRAETGLFALEGVPRFDILYLAPEQEYVPRPAAVLAADRYCRQRGALLVIDPPETWADAAAAATGIRDLGYSSASMLCYYPRLRLRGEAGSATVPAGAALAGLLAGHDRRHGAWRRVDEAGLAFARRYVPAEDLDVPDANLLSRAGLGSIMPGRGGRACFSGTVTLARGGECLREFSDLAIRRFTLQLIAAIEDGTRWAVFGKPGNALLERVRAQVSAYLQELVDAGAIDSVRQVGSDIRHVPDGTPGANKLVISLVFEPAGAGRAIALTLHQTIAGCRVSATAFGHGGSFPAR